MRIGKLTFGVQMPSFAPSKKHRIEVSALKSCSQLAEALGFDSIWVIDHFLKAPVYGQSWLDPFTTLTYIASQTCRVKLGTSVLIVPLRNPVLLAKEIASLQFFSGNRYVFGAAPGWNRIEFEAVQVPRRERGKRTDEIIEIVRLLLREPSASYKGRFYQFPEISIEPLPARRTPVWIGGGSQTMIEGTPEPQKRTAESVIRRIARADGWISPSQTTPELLAADWSRIEAAAREMGRDPSAITFGHVNHYHIVMTEDRDKALEEQRRVFDRYVGAQRPWSYVLRGYLVGSVSDIVRRLRERAAAGATYFILGPATSDSRELERQFELMASEILPQLT